VDAACAEKAAKVALADAPRTGQHLSGSDAVRWDGGRNRPQSSAAAEAAKLARDSQDGGMSGRGLHSSSFKLNLSRF
jgi:hypothetical protein